MARKRLTRAEVREYLGVSERTLYRLIDEGLPVEGVGQEARFPWPEARRWYDERLKGQADRVSGPTSYEEAKARRESALASQEELKLAQMRGELMTKTAGLAWYDAACDRLRAQILTLPVKAAPEVVGVKTAAEALRVLEEHAAALMENLHRGDDVPSAESDDDEGEDEA